MDSQIELNDFDELIPSLRGILEIHNIDKEQYYSIISDILFDFSYFLDQHQESYLHEEIYSYVCDNEELINGEVEEIFMLGELQVKFGNKRKFTANITNIDIVDKDRFRDVMIGLLRLRDIGETLNKQELDDKFLSLVLGKRDGILSVSIKSTSFGDMYGSDWTDYNCEDLSYNCNNLDEALDSIFYLIQRFFHFHV